MKYFCLSVFLVFNLMRGFAQQPANNDNSILLDYYQNQRFDEAAAYLKKIYPEPVTDIKVLRALAYSSQMAGKLPDAEGYYQRIYDLDSTNIAVLYSLGSINLNRGNEVKAEVYYRKILIKDSSNFMVYKQLAKLTLDRKDVVNAMLYLQKANKLNPQEPDVASDLSDLYVNLKIYLPAEKVLSQAITADPENMVLLQSLVKLLYGEKKWTEVITNCEQLMQLGDMSGLNLTRLGIAYFNVNNYQCCVETLSAIEDAEQNETTCYYAAAAYKALKDYNNAIVYFKKTITQAISPNTDSYYSELADSYETIKQFKKALLSYQKALQFKDVPLTWYSIANMYDTELKNRKLALLYYKRYLAADPQKQQSYVNYAKSRVDALSRMNQD